ncbi:recombinase family protein [Bacillus sp. ATD]|uniref:recombinase family protein n=1 Tax=Bacillus sp. ATD TaxID=3422305 RepID=UPI0025A9E240
MYVRVSTEEQAIKGASIDSQTGACMESRNEDALKFDNECFSGKLLERPALNC